MTVTAIGMVKDEADIIEASVENMLFHADRVIVADNGSTDGTREFLESSDAEVVSDREVGYYQSLKMSSLAARAREDGADWVIPFDADEIWTARERIADLLVGLPPEALIAEAAIIDHVATGADAVGPPAEVMEHRRAAVLPLRKVACRAVNDLVIEQGNHGAKFPGIKTPLTVTGQITIRHFPYRSPEQMISKARNGAKAYAATDLPEAIGKHWRDYGKLSDAEIEEVFRKWFWIADPENDPTVVRDPAPCESRS